ncbi:hypothetical protein [Ensifer sp. YR511]|uniref:hypothetical protein n=1 Tax=Ensifer sp. YR511 TaxID=1855294 RepID=UPI0008926B55|nr:hypothetical protein [Ensifer sp. YR511]SDN84295.1 hypothetical protein SAMN05216328_13925 [Ensifer sp. YR511]
MAAYMDDVEVALRIDVEESIFAFTPKNQTEADYLAICKLMARAQLCAVVYQILSEVDRGIEPLTLSHLVGGDWRKPEWSAQAALGEQFEILRGSGAHFSDRGDFELRLTRDYAISGFLEIEIVESGSARAKVTFKLRIPDKVISRAILALLIAGGLLAPSQAPPRERLSESPFIVCSIGQALQGDRDQIVNDAVEDIVDQPGEKDVKASAKWMARQACLYHAGANPGEFDGVRGTHTRIGERQFEDLYGVQVDWGSRIFVRFLLEKANERMQFNPRYRTLPPQ